ncbi:methionine ABC transporter ATP-binding protein [Sphingomonas abietis]|uniref:Methionine ABC transporter ATP-binding protein n=1 Tax=Sphingomonas abietis TaxID=3012344 RepID=A0ABY7NV23_9SPHN|nr:methionine ABC transporter ATP-binding protein [Sphingomonas abietis]WBO23759.1 methionine ABC transporter ATP-binding protein [Sphingomonas abietis]
MPHTHPPDPAISSAISGAEATPPPVAFAGVSRRYPGTARAAVTDISFVVSPGRICGIIGPSGAGKSTVVRLVNGLEQPDQGRVSVFGQAIDGLTPEGLRHLRRRVGMIFQSFGLLSSATVAENIALPLRLLQRSGEDRRLRVAHLLDRVGLTGLGDRYPAQLSGGQKQRVGIARALATDPEILLCDEATSALDPETTRSILRLLDSLNRELGLTIIMVTHQMEVIRDLCDDLVVMDDGRIVEHGEVRDLFLFPRHAVTRRMVAETDPHQPLQTPPGAQVVRATMTGEAARAPLLATIARQTGVDISLLDGRVGRLRSGDYSQLLLALSGEGIAPALAALEAVATIERLGQ